MFPGASGALDLSSQYGTLTLQFPDSPSLDNLSSGNMTPGPPLFRLVCWFFCLTYRPSLLFFSFPETYYVVSLRCKKISPCPFSFWVSPLPPPFVGMLGLAYCPRAAPSLLPHKTPSPRHNVSVFPASNFSHAGKFSSPQQQNSPFLSPLFLALGDTKSPPNRTFLPPPSQLVLLEISALRLSRPA